MSLISSADIEQNCHDRSTGEGCGGPEATVWRCGQGEAIEPESATMLRICAI